MMDTPIGESQGDNRNMADEQIRLEWSAPLERLSTDFYKKLLDNLYDGVYFVDTERQITYWNRAAERLTGYAAGEVVGRHCFDNLLMHTDGKGCNLCISGCPLQESMARDAPIEKEVFLRHRAGHRLAIVVRTNPIKDDQGRVVGAVEVFSDNSAGLAIRQRAEALQEMAYIDPVTGLGNRRFSEMTIRTRLAGFERYDWPFGILLIDVDLFKEINDRYGHQAGDAALQMIGRTLVQSIRPFDFTGRWGGDEFICVFENITLDTLNMLSERSRALVAQSHMPVSDTRIGLTVSLGGTLAKSGDTFESLVARADQNLYRAKRVKRNYAFVE
jgi:diguanylate cyclase (GGDEF)-like protein/PAS domain S-box-containing protein